MSDPIDYAAWRQQHEQADLAPKPGESTEKWIARVGQHAETAARWEREQAEQAQLARREDESAEAWHGRISTYQRQHVTDAPVTTAPTVNASNPGFKATFAGKVMSDENIDDFNHYLPRGANEPADKFAQRLANAGLCLTMTTEQIHANVRAYTDLMASARQRGLPLLIVTGQIPGFDRGDSTAYSDATVAKAFAEAKAAAARAAVTNTPRG